MIALNGRRAHGHAMFPDAPAPAALPQGAELHRIAFVAEAAAGQTVVLEFPEAIGRRAVRVSCRHEE